MKTKINAFSFALAAMLCGASPAWSADTPPKDEHAVNHLVDASDVAGSDLWDFHGNQIGTIEKILLEPSGKITFAIIDADEILDDDKMMALPWSKIYVRTKDGDADEIIYTLDATKQQLRDAPACKDDEEAMKLNDPARADIVYKFWNVDMDKAADPLTEAQRKEKQARIEEVIEEVKQEAPEN